MQDFRNLRVGQKGHECVLAIYTGTNNFSVDERFGLTSQMRRAAVFIPANIAEGCGKHTNADLARYMQISMGSASELECHLLLANDLGYRDTASYQLLHGRVVELKRMMAPFINKLRNKH